MSTEDDQEDPAPNRALTVSILGGGEGLKNLQAQFQRLGEQMRPFTAGLAKWQEDPRWFNILGMPHTIALAEEFAEALKPLTSMQLSRGLTVYLPERAEAPPEVKHFAITVPRKRAGRPPITLDQDRAFFRELLDAYNSVDRRTTKDPSRELVADELCKGLTTLVEFMRRCALSPDGIKLQWWEVRAAAKQYEKSRELPPIFRT
jgi:hypothetical protein